MKHVRRETSTRPLSHITCDSGRRVRPASRLLLQQLKQMMENLQMATPDMNGDDLGDMMQPFGDVVEIGTAGAPHRLHLIEHPMDGSCSFGPWPVSVTCFIASNKSRRAFATGVMREASSRPRYCSSSLALKPKKSGVH